MKKLIRQILGRPVTAVRDSQPSNLMSQRDNPVTIEEGSDNGIRRQLVQMLLRDSLRLHGIPPGWIDCDMLLVSSQSRGPGMYIRLVMRHWDERLLKFAFAFQCSLLADIARFEPHAPEWMHGISWQLEVEADCPYPDMPHPAYWAPRHASQAAVPPPAHDTPPTFAATVPFDFELHGLQASAPTLTRQVVANKQTNRKKSEQEETAADVQRLYTIRDAALAGTPAVPAGNHPPVGYEITQPAPLS